jgi:hypothetical protein
MKSVTTVPITKDSALASPPKPFGSVATPSLNMLPEIQVVFVDEVWVDSRPALDYYRKLYTDADYPSETIESLLAGLSQSSLYEGQAS